MSDNPFHPPQTAAVLPGLQGLVAADPGARFLARTIDQILLVAGVLPSVLFFFFFFAVLPPRKLDVSLFLLGLLPSLVVLFVLTLYQWWLTATKGTSIGKRLLGIRIVNAQGGPPGFFAGLVLRRWAPALVTGALDLLLGAAGTGLTLLDWLMVFSEGGLTLHDRLAGTRVIRDRP